MGFIQMVVGFGYLWMAVFFSWVSYTGTFILGTVLTNLQFANIAYLFEVILYISLF